MPKPKIVRNESRYFGDRTLFGRLNEKSEFVLSLSLAYSSLPSFYESEQLSERSKRRAVAVRLLPHPMPFFLSYLYLYPFPSFQLLSLTLHPSFLSLSLLFIILPLSPSLILSLSSHSLPLPSPSGSAQAAVVLVPADRVLVGLLLHQSSSTITTVYHLSLFHTLVTFLAKFCSITLTSI